jgi:hypothetical protein
VKVEAIYTPTIMDGAVVRFQTGFNRGTFRALIGNAERTEWSAEINASRNGVSLNGQWPVYRARDDVAGLGALLAMAWKAYHLIAGGEDGGHEAAKHLVEQFNATYKEGFPQQASATAHVPDAPGSAGAASHSHGDNVLAATTLAIESCIGGHAIVLLLLNERGKPFADAHLPLDHIEPIIAKLRQIRSDLGGAQVGHG